MDQSPSLAELERERLLRACARDNELVGLVIEKCRRDVTYWVSNFVWTFDPRILTGPRDIPLIPFDRQRDYLNWLVTREKTQTSGVVCKGRDVGITWLSICFAVHRWLFQEGYIITFGSRRENLVDKLGDLDAILPKARFLIARLPPFLRPRTFQMERHANFMQIVNPESRSVIKGETGDEMGRGGRSSAFFIDEAAKVERLAGVFAAVSATTDVEIDVSTPGLPGDPFDQRCDRADLHALFEIDWRDDPRKTKEWAAAERERIGYLTFAREFERDRKISQEGLVIQPSWVEAARRLQALTGLEPSGFVVCGGDVGGGGSGKSVIVARAGPIVFPPIDWTDPTPTAFRFLEEAGKRNAKVLNYDSIGVGLSVTNDFTRMTATEKESRIAINGINVGEAPDKRRKWPDGKTSAEKFQNLRAELWWMMRDRLEKTFQHVAFLEGDLANGLEHPLDELLALPADPALAAQLSMPTWHPSNSGKIQIESKADLRRRGVPSPDRADALALTMPEAGTAKAKVIPLAPISLERINPYVDAG